MKMTRPHLDSTNPLVEESEWHFMNKMEFLNPWNPQDDPWAISEIIDHRDPKGTIMEFLVRYHPDSAEEWVPYHKVKQDEPWLVAKYVKEKGLKFKCKRRKQHVWATKYIKGLDRMCRRLCDISLINDTVNEDQQINNRRGEVHMMKEMHGLPCPKSVKCSLELDRIHNNSKWKDAMAKEISIMKDYQVFDHLMDSQILNQKDGWQFAPLHWVFTIKHDLRHKARLVIGAHVTTADDLDKYTATTSMDGVKLQLFLTARSGKKVILGDISSAYLNRYTKEKIWTNLSPEFGDVTGRVQVKKSLYGLITSAHVWFEALTKIIRDFGFTPSKIMPCL